MLVNLLLTGGDITDQDSANSQTCLTIAQLINLFIFNCEKFATAKKETPLLRN